MGRPELQNRRTECEQAGLRCAGAASNQHTQDEELRPQDRPAARCGGGAAGVQKDGGLPLDVPVTGEGGLSHHTRRGTPQTAAHSGTRRMQACEVPRPSPYFRNAGAGERHGCENALRHAGPLSAATTLDIYTHITDDMRLTAAANIDRGIGKAAPQEETSESGQETAPAQAEKLSMTDFKPYVGRKRKSGTGCVTEINDHLFEGRYSPKWPDGKKHARNVYAHTREECEEKLKVLIVEMKAELAELKRQKKLEIHQNGTALR